MTGQLRTTQTRTVAMDYGYFVLVGGESAYTLDPMPLLDLALVSGGPGVVSDGRAVIVLSPHQNNFSLDLAVEVWDGEPADDADEWEQVLRAWVEVTDDRLVFEAPTLDSEPFAVPTGRYAVLVSGRGFVARGWPGSTTPGDRWRVRLWPEPLEAPAYAVRTWTAPPPPEPDPTPVVTGLVGSWLSSLDPAVRALLPQNGPVTMADVHEAMARAYEWDEEQIERSRRIREGLD